MKNTGKFVVKIMKKIIIAFCFIYAFNLIATGLNVIIPLNIITISIVTVLGIPGLIALIVMCFII